MMWNLGYFLVAVALSTLPLASTESGNASDSRVAGPDEGYGNNGLPPGLAALGVRKSAEATHSRQVFFVGGQYVTDPTTKFTRFVSQMYVEQLLPQGGVRQKNPLVFFHGGGVEGATWLQTPDNRRGWASYFLDKGYAVYLVDVTKTGRSPRASSQAAGDVLPVELAQAVFSAPEKTPNTYPQAKLHNKWPGTGVRGDPIFDAWYPSLIQTPSDVADTEVSMRKDVCQLLSRIGNSFLIAHSYSGHFLWVAADECPDRIQGIFGIEPDTPPFQAWQSGQSIPTRPWGITNSPVKYDPPVTDPQSQLVRTAVTVGTNTAGNHSCLLQKEPARKLPNLAKVPIYFYTSDASIHITYDHCIHAFLNQAGVKNTWQQIGELGFKGHGHFSFIEKGNLQLAELAEKFFKQHAGKRGPPSR